jgi:hypothetical protein
MLVQVPKLRKPGQVGSAKDVAGQGEGLRQLLLGYAKCRAAGCRWAWARITTTQLPPAALPKQAGLPENHLARYHCTEHTSSHFGQVSTTHHAEPPALNTPREIAVHAHIANIHRAGQLYIDWSHGPGESAGSNHMAPLVIPPHAGLA